MTNASLSQQLIQFIQRSPTPFHATEEMKSRLSAAGFIELRESDRWNTHAGARYFLTRNGSSIIAFTLGDADLSDTGLRILHERP